ncbi:putative disease resistance protein RGA3 isoform X3 [Spinacia oleracea]|uniref:Disease resistance protein RGA3 isoform X3 n=1 Tax=Spinacia oleracea TaxID=3562 RepID=A0ABM3RF52_SPIOL|nr:putative disease resistance protein RGA3 isoform X3 [Spinacia oleracea]
MVVYPRKRATSSLVPKTRSALLIGCLVGLRISRRGMLLNPIVERDVSVLTIVGVGGLGKTALAQLVYNNPRITSAFPLRSWTCVSDQDQKDMDVKEILCKILEENNANSTMNKVQSQLKEKLSGEKYLLVLDDVWTEKRHQWCDLANYFAGGESGSCILVTTRSHKTATIVGGSIYELQGLSEENSWRLFERAAFASDHSKPPDELVKIGREIVDGCARVPLAIRVAGSLLYGQDKSKWQLVREIGLASTRESEDNIMPILKLSFYHLDSSLKSCFSYCALFPKDVVIDKERLIRLWIAQGYVVPLDKGQSIEDAGEEHFTILLRRCFFQDIMKDESGEIESFKVHDLMHDIAQRVSGKEIYVMNSISGSLDKKVRHLSLAGWMGDNDKYSLGKTHIRSHLNIVPQTQLPVKALVANCRCLRALDLSELSIKSLPDSIGELLHLRFLDISGNGYLEVLPKSITNLYNLQTLDIGGCRSLKELPKDLSRLVNLSVLNISSCRSLTYMPRDMDKLSCLHKLKGVFKVGGEGRCSSWNQWFYGLKEIKSLNNLKGRLEIRINWPENATDVIKEGSRGEGLYLRNKEHVNEIEVLFNHDEEGDRRVDDEGALSLMEDLEPHSNIKFLTVSGYNGLNMPSWVGFLQSLAELRLYCCKELDCLPSLRNLCHLKVLKLSCLKKLEYIEAENSCSTMSSPEDLSFFLSLEQLELCSLPKLKGWRRGMDDSSSSSNPQLPCLSQLKSLAVIFSPELSCIPLCPNVEVLELIKFNERLRIISTERDEKSSSSTSRIISVPKLREVEVDNVAWLDSLPIESFQCLDHLTLKEDYELVDLPNWMQFLPALQTLEIKGCRGLKAIPNWMPKLTSLRTLKIYGCSESLWRRCHKDPPGEEYWPYIQHIPHRFF